MQATGSDKKPPQALWGRFFRWSLLGISVIKALECLLVVVVTAVPGIPPSVMAAVNPSPSGMPVTSSSSGDWDSTAAGSPWPGGTVPSSGFDVTIAAGHTVTIKHPQAAMSVTVNSSGHLFLDGTADSATLTITNGQALANSGEVKITDSSNPVTIKAATGGTASLSGTAVALNGKSLHLARINYAPTLSIASGETVTVDDTCQFTSIQTVAGASLVQSNYVTVTVTGATSLASGTFTRSVGGKLKLNGTISLGTANQNLGDVVTGP